MKRLQRKVIATVIGSLVLLSAGSGCAGKSTKPDEAYASLEASAKKETIPLVGNFKVHRYQLGNGLRLLVVEDHTSPTLAYHTWFRVGSRDEVPGYTGLAHLFEHMMFKETKSLKEGEFDRILESNGAEGENAFTSRDYTAYVQELPSDKLDLIARLESERMVNLVVNEKAFKTETEVVQNERRFRNENSPDGLMYQELFGVAFTQHPYRWPVIGYQEDLDRMSGQNAVEFYKTYYSPNHATVIVIGDVRPGEVLATVEKYYGHLPAQASQPKALTEEPAQTSPRRKKLDLNMQVEKILMGYHVPDVMHPDVAAIDVLQTVLTGGKSSRLHRALVETGIASAVDSYDLDDKDPSLFILMANLQKGKRTAQAESVILKEIGRIAKTPPSEKEMERAKNRINFMFYESLNSNSDKARFLGHYETVANGFEKALEIYKRIQAVTAADVQAAAKKYLDPKNRSVIIGVPK